MKEYIVELEFEVSNLRASLNELWSHYQDTLERIESLEGQKSDSKANLVLMSTL